MIHVTFLRIVRSALEFANANDTNAVYLSASGPPSCFYYRLRPRLFRSLRGLSTGAHGVPVRPITVCIGSESDAGLIFQHRDVAEFDSIHSAA